MDHREDNWPQLNLSDKEWQELMSLEYVLTHGYSEDEKVDEKRLKELREKKYLFRDGS
jgi:hypothetical protein